MAKGINQVTIGGNVGRDPEMKYTATGKAVTSFSVAVTTGYGDNERTEWFDVTAWEKLAEVIANYVTKGTQITVIGRLQTDKYEKDGVEKRFTKVIAQDVMFKGAGAPIADTFGDKTPPDDLPF